MEKLLKLQSILLREIDKYEKLIPTRDEPADWERVHISSSACIGQMLAIKREVDPKLAACACACHDYGRIITGVQACHGEAGYLPVQDLLHEAGGFSEEEIGQIAAAVKNHSKKDETGSPLEEIVKDADVLDMYLYGRELPRAEQKERLSKLLNLL